MTEKAKRIEKALNALKLQKANLLTMGQLDDIATMAGVTRLEVMMYLRYR